MRTFMSGKKTISQNAERTIKAQQIQWKWNAPEGYGKDPKRRTTLGTPRYCQTVTARHMTILAKQSLWRRKGNKERRMCQSCGKEKWNSPK